ncbi:MAG: flagellar hook-associated protein FlgK [Pseudomonadota bacterium]
MSISAALNSAISGLNASSRQVQAISNNLANSLTPGYGARSVELTAGGGEIGGGVRVTAINRDINDVLLNDRRRADSAVAASTTSANFFAEIERLLATPEDANSITARLAQFEASLVTASVRPEEVSRLQASVLSGADVANALNVASDRVQVLRTEAETQIQKDVADANEYLRQLDTLNGQIIDTRNRGTSAASFEDQRSLVMDQLAEIMPLRVFERDNGSIAIYTPTGAGLLDGKPAELTFSATNLVTADMTQANGLLSGLEINGNPVRTDGMNSPIAGGRLAANFNLRDELAVDTQAQLDAVARNLVERFQTPGVDPTQGATDPGLFTDGGAFFDPANEVGLAGRIALSDAVKPDAGGDFWRLRDGLYAAAPGPSGDATVLNNIADALTDQGALVSGNLGGTARGVSGHMASMMSYFGQQRLSLDQTVSFAQANQTGLIETELAQGVNSDEELQQLLLVEQAFAANARLIQTAGDMLDQILGI